MRLNKPQAESLRVAAREATHNRSVVMSNSFGSCMLYGEAYQSIPVASGRVLLKYGYLEIEPNQPIGTGYRHYTLTDEGRAEIERMESQP